ncbi:MAG: sugar transferase [Rhodothermales bacterium]|nr:sugar transferase [Rhodothermales bacterium]MBO6779562.1 sugar transferase [Rhodothermales bacterium]
MIHASTYEKPRQPRLDKPIVEHFDVDGRFLEARAGRREELPGKPNLWPNVLGLAGADAVALTTAGWSASLLAGGVLSALWLPLFASAWMIMAALQHLYPGWGVGPVDRMRAQFRGLTAGVGLSAVFLSLTAAPRAEYLALLAAGALALPLLMAARGATRALFRKFGRWGVDCVVYGTSDAASRVVQLLAMQPAVGYLPQGIFEDNPRLWGRMVCGVPVLGDANLVHPDAPVAIVTGDGSRACRQHVDFLLKFYRDVVYVPDLMEQSTSTTRMVDFGGLLGLKLSVNLASGTARALKRSLDLVATIATIPFWGAVVGVGAVLVWLGDRKSPFYRQERIGRGGRCISVLKLRTMVHNAEEVLKEALERDESLRLEWEATSKLQEDPRITAVGRVLRRLSIDELPQLVNVLRGDMALVGPRPLPKYHEERLEDDARELRRRVRPGVTGLWQISGRSNTGDAGIEWLDAYYVRSWTPWLDLAILLRTFRAAIAGEGAY